MAEQYCNLFFQDMEGEAGFGIDRRGYRASYEAIPRVIYHFGRPAESFEGLLFFPLW